MLLVRANVSNRRQPRRRTCPFSQGWRRESLDFFPQSQEGDWLSRTAKEGWVKEPLGDLHPTDKCGCLGQSSPRPGPCPVWELSPKHLQGLARCSRSHSRQAVQQGLKPPFSDLLPSPSTEPHTLSPSLLVSGLPELSLPTPSPGHADTPVPSLHHTHLNHFVGYFASVLNLSANSSALGE